MAKKTKTTKTTIPTELYRPIVSKFKDRRTLLILCLTSRTFRSEAERILYRDVTRLKTLKTQKNFLGTITTHPHLALHVQAFASSDMVTLDGSKEDAAFKELISSALRLMVNLKDLEICGKDQKPCAAILRGCTFSLERLIWKSKSDAGELAKFLPSQTELKELSVSWSPREITPFPATLLTKLETLQGNQSTVDAFLPGRSITTLSWDPDLSSALTIDHLSKEFNNLRVLGYGGTWSRPPLSIIAGNLDSLEVLSLYDYYETDIDDVPRFSNLKRVMYSGRAIEYKNMHGLIANILLETMPTLERVDFRFEDKVFKERRQVSFIRGSQPRITPLDYPMF